MIVEKQHPIKELQCIQAADAMRITCTRAELEAMRNDNTSILDEWRPSAIEWEPSLSGRIQQIALLPVAFLLLVPLCIVGQWLCCQYEWIALRSALLTLLMKPRFRISEPPLPEQKTLWHLWQMHGSDREDHISFGNSIRLLNQWIVILYGQETADSLNIEGRINEMRDRRCAMNKPYYEGAGDAPHFHFVPILETLIEQLHEELPPYK